MQSDSIARDSSFVGSHHADAFLAHEVRNLVNVAILLFEVLKTLVPAWRATKDRCSVAASTTAYADQPVAVGNASRARPQRW